MSFHAGSVHAGLFSRPLKFGYGSDCASRVPGLVGGGAKNLQVGRVRESEAMMGCLIHEKI